MVRTSSLHGGFAMSPSTRSRPASASSPASGSEASETARPPSAQGPVEIELEVSRQRQIAWTIGGILGGTLLIFKLGTVGVWVGYVLVALGLWRAYQLVMSFLYPAGKIVVSD